MTIDQLYPLHMPSASIYQVLVFWFQPFCRSIPIIFPDALTVDSEKLIVLICAGWDWSFSLVFAYLFNIHFIF
jgi:hypothetical protein